MFKLNYKNTRTTSVCIVDFEEVNVSWSHDVRKIST